MPSTRPKLIDQLSLSPELLGISDVVINDVKETGDAPCGICKNYDNHPATKQTLNWFERNGHHTKPYDDCLILQLIGSTQTDVAKKEGLTEEILQGVMDRYKIDEMDWNTIDRIGLLGINEITKKKGYQDFNHESL